MGYMDSTTVALDREAYELLRTAKRPGESFSAAVKRLARPRLPLSKFVGTWSSLPPKELQAMRDSLMEGRRASRAKAKKLHARR